MTTVATDKAINTRRLSEELGGIGFRIEFDGTTRTITADVDAATLQAKIDAHVAIDEDGNRRTLEQRAVTALAANATYLARTSPTTAQQTAQIKALTQQVNALIRLQAGALDATD